MKTYRGTPPHDVVVTSDTPGVAAIPLVPRLDLRNHSATGFSWGYAGSGPSQLALAILADVSDDETAQRRYQAFKWTVIAKLPGDSAWELTEDQVRGWLAEGR